MGLLLINVILALVIGKLSRKIKTFEKSYTALQSYASGQTLDTLLNEYLTDVDTLKARMRSGEVQLEEIKRKLKVAVDQVELIRFSAFEKGGSDLSFSLAMLNSKGDGVVITSIQTREDCRLYAKPVQAGKSTYTLSDEERQVIDKALAART